MEKQSKFMRERLLQNHERRVTIARTILIGVGSFYFLGGLINSFIYGKVWLIEIILGAIFLLIHLIEKRYERGYLLLGLALCVVILMVQVIRFRILGIVLFGIIIHRVFLAFTSAQFIAENMPSSEGGQDILDDDFRVNAE